MDNKKLGVILLIAGIFLATAICGIKTRGDYLIEKLVKEVSDIFKNIKK